jgi:hypothetical protein
MKNISQRSNMEAQMKKFAYVGIIVAYTLVLSGCAENQTKVGEGAALGGIMGAVLGGVVGHQQKGNRDLGGALIGGALGAAAGGVVGAQMPNENAAPKRRVVQGDSEPISQITMRQIVDWTQQGLSGDKIIQRISTTGSTYALTADDIGYLRKEGVSQRVIEAMQGR